MMLLSAKTKKDGKANIHIVLPSKKGPFSQDLRKGQIHEALLS